MAQGAGALAGTQFLARRRLPARPERDGRVIPAIGLW